MRVICNSVALLLLFSVLASAQDVGSIVGKLIDITGAAIWQAQIKLESERGDKYSTEANSEGEFSFSRLLLGDYTLTATSAGFVNLTVRGINITGNETKALTPLRLSIGSNGWCNFKPMLKYIRFVDGETRTGDLEGRIELEEGPKKAELQGIADAEVKLLCGKHKVCRTTTTHQDGEFRFTGLDPGEFTIEVRRAGYYLQKEAGYKVDAGRESMYDPIYLEKCFRGACNPSKRPKKSVALCF